ncbi:hypothetical protein MXB_2959 [Myxobolus squamalis]|nr:hypothetical protein MXB_2959 [Myxobolus squamalis]
MKGKNALANPDYLSLNIYEGLLEFFFVNIFKLKNEALTIGQRKNSVIRYCKKNIKFFLDLDINGFNMHTLKSYGYSPKCQTINVFNVNKTVLMDDSRFHKTTIVSKLFRLPSFNFDYLPHYGPELNPIEAIFSC